MSVRVVTDTASSLSASQLDRLSIVSIPLHVTAQGADLSEDELGAPDFYDRLQAGDVLPTTSQPSPEEFATVFRSLIERGHDVLAVLVSEGMSGTVESARLAAAQLAREHHEAAIEVFGTLSNSMEEGFAALAAAEAAHAGAVLSECRQAAAETVRRTRFLFAPHTLEHLHRGGRIGSAATLLGSMLKVVPVLTADKGATAIASAARSGASAWARIGSLMRKDVERCGLAQVVVQYAANRDEAERFAREVIAPIAGDRPVPVAPIHPIVGLHVGPAVGVAYETVEPLR